MPHIDTEVLVIGGGATGAGVARDLAMRGFRTTLVERNDWASGTTGRYNGLLHSGSRYSVNHLDNARECIQENRILRRIMPHCIEDTGGYVVAAPVDDPAYGDRLVAGCRAAGIPIAEVPVATVLREEPFVNPGIRRALHVPDAPADSFLATLANVEAARQYGARALNYHAVVELLTVGGRVAGAVCHDRVRDERVTITADLVINAAGAWAGKVAALVGIRIPLLCSQGSMIATNFRLVNTVITRLRRPSPVDSVLCSHTVSVLGCTDVVIDDPDHCAPQPGELRQIVDECSQLVPAARDVRRLRVWCGVRPLYQTAAVNGASGQGLSRSHVILDHAVTDGLDGLLSVVGGKWTTYRLMAEQTTDQACRKLGTRRPCRTHLEPLPGAEKRSHHRRGERLAHIEQAVAQGELVCECELVERAAVERALLSGSMVALDDLRRSTRLGMGPCQGAFCGFRAAGLHHTLARAATADTRRRLMEFLQARWQGIVPVVAGDQLRQLRLNELLYRDVLPLP
jgi:glycerol-3-phosphate dehydrogenase